jgi:hypothetical protein
MSPARTRTLPEVPPISAAADWSFASSLPSQGEDTGLSTTLPAPSKAFGALSCPLIRFESSRTCTAGGDAFHLCERAVGGAMVVNDRVLDPVGLHVEMPVTMTRDAHFFRHTHLFLHAIPNLNTYFSPCSFEIGADFPLARLPCRQKSRCLITFFVTK